MLKKKSYSFLTMLYVMLGMLGTSAIVMAAPGLKTGWIFQQLALVVLVVSVGLAIMFYVQKATAKMITTIVVGAFLYILASNPTGTFQSLGNFLKGLLGL